MPEFGRMLRVLMSITGGMYVGLKFPEKQT